MRLFDEVTASRRAFLALTAAAAAMSGRSIQAAAQPFIIDSAESRRPASHLRLSGELLERLAQMRRTVARLPSDARLEAWVSEADLLFLQIAADKSGRTLSAPQGRGPARMTLTGRAEAPT